MWKYSSKSQLLILFFAFLVGIGIMAVTFDESAAIYGEVFSQEIVDFMYSNIAITYIISGISIAAIANSILLIQMVMRKSPVGIFIIMGILLFSSAWITIIGLVLLIPAVIAHIYGAISLSKEQKEVMKQHGITCEEDLITEYKSKHQLKEDVRGLAQTCRKANDKINYIYMLGIIALLMMMLMISNLWVLVIAFLFYTYAFSYINRYRMSNIIPIKQLLYEKCDPEACASAVIYFSYKRNKFKCKDYALLAQCLIYLDDVELAEKVLCLYPRGNEAAALTYYSLMGYIYYILKDEAKLQECKDKASRLRMNASRAGVMIQSAEIGSIQNKLDLMNGNFNVCRKYYLNAYQRANFPFQQVDSAYYIALISFVEEDYVVAKTYFERVVQKGNGMHFVAKSEHYLSKINAMNLEEV